MAEFTGENAQSIEVTGITGPNGSDRVYLTMGTAVLETATGGRLAIQRVGFQVLVFAADG